MRTFLLLRSTELLPEELKRLPGHCYPIRNGHPVIARADLAGSIKDVVAMAVHIARAVPDVEIVFHENKAAPVGVPVDRDEFLGHSAQVQYPSLSVEIIDVEPQDIEVLEVEVLIEQSSSEAFSALAFPNRSIFDRMEEELEVEEENPPNPVHWWDFVEMGQTDVALSMLKGRTLSHDDQCQAKALLKSGDPEAIVFICYAAKIFQWKSWVLTLRKCFLHSDVRVRKAALIAVGELAGPSMAPSVFPLMTDSHPEVRRAASVAYRKLNR
jgi:hypothetical protein